MSTATTVHTTPRRGAENPADSHDLIRVHGARENNLKDVSVELPEAAADGVHRASRGRARSSLVFRDDRGGVTAA